MSTAIVWPAAAAMLFTTGPVLESFPGFDAYVAGGDGDLDFSGRVEEPAEVADGRLALAVPLAGLGPLAGQAEGRERIGRRLIEMAVGPDDVEPAGRRPAGGAVADGDLEPGRVRASGRLRLTRLGETGRRDDQGLVIRRGGTNERHAEHDSDRNRPRLGNCDELRIPFRCIWSHADCVHRLAVRTHLL